MADSLHLFALAVIEGFTEFLPVSSTGHMILYDEFFSGSGEAAGLTYMVVIQAGAMLAVLHIYFAELWKWTKAFVMARQEGGRPATPAQRSFLPKLALSVLPFGLVGFVFRDNIKAAFHADSVAWALIVGGLILIADELVRKRKGNNNRVDVESWTWKDALVVGVFQCAALWPGFSRSAAAILGARWVRFSPEGAAHLSFLVGLPTLVGTAGYEMVGTWSELSPDGVTNLLWGSAVAWISAFVSVKWFLSIVGKGGLAGFGIYRCILGVGILFLTRLGG